MTVCSWCKTPLDPKKALVLRGWGHGCRQEDWQACSDRAEQNYQASLVKERAA